MATTTDIYIAIEENNLDEVKRVYPNGASLTLTNSHAYSVPLYQAACLGHTDIVRYLLEKHDLFVDDGDDTTCFSPLMTACENGYLEIAELLLKHGADVNRQYEKETESDETDTTYQELGYPLTLAVENGHAEIVRLLLEYDADTECVKWSYDGSNTSQTPLMLALRSNKLEVAELLIANDANCCGECRIESKAHTPLSYYIACADLERVKWLLDHGADPNCLAEIDDMGNISGFMYAVYLGVTSKKRIEERYEIVVLLLKHGVDFSYPFHGWDFNTVPELVLEYKGDRYLQLFGLKNIKEKIAELEEYEKQEDSLLPDALEIKIGSQVSPAFKVILINDMLVWQVYDPEDNLLDTKELPIRERDWVRFWMLCDMAGIWCWQELHKGPDIPDGKSWSVHICYRGKEAHASGFNAFPVDEDYPDCKGYTPLFRKFLRAVNDLLHGLPFE